MPEELQGLLDRIRKDGVDKARVEAEKIVSDASEQAKSIISRAETDAESKIEKARKEAEAFEERSRKALEQAARDVVLSVGETVNAVFRGIVGKRIAGTLDIDALKRMLVKVVEAYVGRDSGSARMEILLNPGQQAEIEKYFMSELGEAVRSGIEIKSDGSVVAGFKVSMPGEDLEHDFTDAAVADSLCVLLRPKLAEIVRNALNGSKPDSSRQ